MNDGVSDRTLKVVQIAGRLVLIAVSAGIFIYAVENARMLVRLLSGIPSFLSLATIVIFGIGELSWVIFVADTSLPKKPAGTMARLLRFLGGEAIAFVAIGVIPMAIVSVGADLPFLALATPAERILLPAAVALAVACFLFGGRR